MISLRDLSQHIIRKADQYTSYQIVQPEVTREKDRALNLLVTRFDPSGFSDLQNGFLKRTETYEKDDFLADAYALFSK